MSRLDKIREELKKQQVGNNNKTYKKDTSVFPHWQMPVNTATILRFLPDGNEDNIFFWVERQTINLPFNGVKGTDHDKKIIVKVPCVDMFKPRSCPITQEIVPWFKTDMDALARRYWKNRHYFFQGFVTQTELEEDDKPENPIRRFVMSKSIFKIIQESLLDTDNFDSSPTDYENGVNFRIKKTIRTTKDGEQNDYSTSTWERKETALGEDQLQAINDHGLYDLSSFLPARPNDNELEIIFDMFKASLDDQPYDADRWKGHYEPWGLNNILGENSSVPTGAANSDTPSQNDDLSNDDLSDDDDDDDDDTSTISADESNDDSEPEERSPVQNANDILEQLKNRAKAKSE